MRKAGLYLLFAVLVASCSPDANEQANKLFVEAQQLIENAGKQAPEERVRSLRSAEDKLKAIVANYPTANLAVQLASGQSVGTVSLKSVSAAIKDARCVSVPTSACILDRAVLLAQSITDQERRASAFRAIAVSQAKTGRIAEAVQLAQLITVDRLRAAALIAIAEVQAKAGMTKDAAATFDQAAQLAQSIGKLFIARLRSVPSPSHKPRRAG